MERDEGDAGCEEEDEGEKAEEPEPLQAVSHAEKDVDVEETPGAKGKDSPRAGSFVPGFRAQCLNCAYPVETAQNDHGGDHYHGEYGRGCQHRNQEAGAALRCAPHVARDVPGHHARQRKRCEIADCGSSAPECDVLGQVDTFDSPARHTHRLHHPDFPVVLLEGCKNGEPQTEACDDHEHEAEDDDHRCDDPFADGVQQLEELIVHRGTTLRQPCFLVGRAELIDSARISEAELDEILAVGDVGSEALVIRGIKQEALGVNDCRVHLRVAHQRCHYVLVRVAVARYRDPITHADAFLLGEVHGDADLTGLDFELPVIHVEEVVEAVILGHEADVHDAVFLGCVRVGEIECGPVYADHFRNLEIVCQLIALGPCLDRGRVDLPRVHLYEVRGLRVGEEAGEGAVELHDEPGARCHQQGREQNECEDHEHRRLLSGDLVPYDSCVDHD